MTVEERQLDLRVHLEFFGHTLEETLGEETYPLYSTKIEDAWLIMTEIRMKLFSHRLRYKLALRQVISERLGGGTLHSEEIIMKVIPIDFCCAALIYKDMDVNIPWQ